MVEGSLISSFQVFAIFQNISKHYDKLWQKRSRKIDTIFLITFIIKLIFSKSNLGYQSVLEEIWGDYKLGNLKLPQKNPFSASSVCEARQKFPASIINQISSNLVNEFLQLNDKKYRWKGKRVFAIDGSEIHLPHELLKNGYHKFYENDFEPHGYLSCLFHVGTGVILDVGLNKNYDERASAKKHFNMLSKDDIILFDRGYFSYEFCLFLDKNKSNYLFRIRDGMMLKPIMEFIASSETDRIVEITPTNSVLYKNKTKEQRELLLKTKIKIRLIKYNINSKESYLATSIMDKDISILDFVALYHERWGIEEHYKIKKSILDIQHFHSKSENGILQELYCSTLFINLTRMISSEVNETLDKKNPVIHNNEEKKTVIPKVYILKILGYLIRKSTLRKRNLKKH